MPCLYRSTFRRGYSEGGLYGSFCTSSFQVSGSYPGHVKRLRKQDARGNLVDAQRFLAANAKEEGVLKMRSGLQYKILQTASGRQPSMKDTVSVHYHGTFINGDVFDSSVARGEPTNFNLETVIPGFREALTNMHVGEKWKIFVPPSLGYGPKGVAGSIGANELLIFEIELLVLVWGLDCCFPSAILRPRYFWKCMMLHFQQKLHRRLHQKIRYHHQNHLANSFSVV